MTENIRRTQPIMETQNILVIFLTIIDVLISVFLFGFIIRYIQSKPPISITLVDLIYCDFLCWLALTIYMYASGIIICHLSPR